MKYLNSEFVQLHMPHAFAWCPNHHYACSHVRISAENTLGVVIATGRLGKKK